jgi:hypothetical protein
MRLARAKIGSHVVPVKVAFSLRNWSEKQTMHCLTCVRCERQRFVKSLTLVQLPEKRLPSGFPISECQGEKD